MLTRYLTDRARQGLEQGAKRRIEACGSARTFESWRTQLRAEVAGMLDLGEMAEAPLNARTVARHERRHHFIENVLFESIAGWQVNATLFLPRDPAYAPPYPAIVVPCGHSTKTGPSYQLPCQTFARAGCVAITFDAPGQDGEKQRGNDHFSDGPRCYAVGHSSVRYFVADAIRAIDYLETREDVDMRSGVAMTGVSGGGHTTMWAAAIDDRIAVAGPVCCATRLNEHPIGDAYAWCPETFPIGRLACGIDDADLMVAAAPRPMLFQYATRDAVMPPAMSEAVASDVAEGYALLGAEQAFEARQVGGEHAYTIASARRFVRFADAHWLGDPDRRHGAAFEQDPQAEPAPALLCRPMPTPNMRTITAATAQRHKAQRPRLARRADAKQAVLAAMPGVEEAAALDVVRGGRQRVWACEIEELRITSEPGIELPATLVWPSEADETGSPMVIAFDSTGRYAPLSRGGWLATTCGVMDSQKPDRPVGMTVDLRGWGDTRPAASAFDVAGWSRMDRWSHVAAALNDSLMTMRVRDALASIRWLGEQPGVDAGRAVVAGRGSGAVVALIVGALIEGLRGVVCQDPPPGIEALVEAESYAWPTDLFIPGVLRHFDLPELVAAVGEVRVVHQRDATGDPAGPGENEGAVVPPWIADRLSG